ncbi:IS66 family insertion sequence element accessory protein TnpB [Roseburia hominis]|uniref:IS66 family insertion sequence element accessory protein TnpA n=1 Tax=Roseburia hominis TaxID=301301 RepID=UPI001F25AE7B|nr:IS66 family insertion sequence element accessory protein TnpB [Roseburia hominis]
MRTEINLVAEQVRLQQWAALIKDCQNRPAGMSVDTWCSQNGISKPNYYYCLRRVRQAIMECIPNSEESENSNPGFVELPVSSGRGESNVAPEDCRQTPVRAEVIAILRGANGISIEILPGISSEMLHTIMEGFAHAQ